MSLHAQLLDQARHLLGRDSHRPRQASLRRAVSAAYYAVFHLLVRDASRMLVKGEALRALVARAFEHSDMKQASWAFSSRGQLPASVRAVVVGSVPAELQLVADTFVDLQDARLEADYKVNRTYRRAEVADLVDQAELAFEAWAIVRGQPIAGVYLAALLLWRKWR